MKNLLLTLSIVCCLSVACKESSSPKEVAKEFLEAIDNANFDKAKHNIILNDENTKAIANIEKFYSQMTKDEKRQYINKTKEYNFIEQGITDTTATIVATNNQGMATIAVEFNLKKQNSRWLIERFTSRY